MTSKPAQSPLARWMPALAAVAVLVVVVVAASAGGGDDDATVGGAPGASELAVDSGNSEYVVSDLTVPQNVSGGIGTESTSVPIVKTQLSATLATGNTGDSVKAVQTRLTQLGFVPGAADGIFGEQTRQAVWAFEKLVMLVPRDQATGTVTNEMWQRMQDPLVVQPRRPATGTHVEIYLPEQVAAVFTDDVAKQVIHISSGTGEEWCETVKLDTDAKGNPIDPPVEKAECGISTTPGGVFKFTHAVTGKRNGPLGGMDNPIYFNYGIAMHGAKDVPLHPASHGCIRMLKVISDTFQSYVSVKDRVYVWGEDGRQPEQYSAKESLPVFNYADKNATTTTVAPTTTVPKTTTTVAPTTTAPATTTTRPPTTTTTMPATTTTQVPATTTSAPS